MRTGFVGPLFAWLLAVPLEAWAHSPMPGVGRFYSGMLHPVLAPAALIALLALGLLIGQRGLTASRRPVLALALGLLLGLLAGSQWVGVLSDNPADIVLLVLGLVCAACALLAWPVPMVWLLGLATVLGLATGLGLADMAVGAARWVVIAGTWLGAALVTVAVAAVAELARHPWQRIALRVVASWLAASALLVLGLQWLGPVGQAKPAAMSLQRNHPPIADGGGGYAVVLDFFSVAPAPRMPE